MSDRDREEFEKFYASLNDGFCPSFYNGEYDWADAQNCWLTWQSACAYIRLLNARNTAKAAQENN